MIWVNNKTKLYIILKPFFRNKKNLFSILLLGICSLIIIVIFSFNSTLQNYIKIGLMKDISYRTIFIDYDYSKESESEALLNISKVKHIETAFNKSEYFTIVDVDSIGSKKVKGNFKIQGINKLEKEKILYGKNIDGENQVICPAIFVPNENSEEVLSGKTKSINLKKYLNENIKTTFYVTTFSDAISDFILHNNFKIVGLYRNNENYLDENVCYASFSTIKKINEVADKYVENSPGVIDSIIAYVDNVSSMEGTIKNLSELGYSAGRIFELDTSFLLAVNIFSIVLIIVIIIATIIIVGIINNKKISDKIVEINLYRSFGYSIKEIKELLLIENLLISIISVFFSFFIMLIIFLIIKTIIFFNPFIFMKMPLTISYLSLLISLIVSVVSTMISVLIFQQKIFSNSLIGGISR